MKFLQELTETCFFAFSGEPRTVFSRRCHVLPLHAFYPLLHERPSHIIRLGCTKSASAVVFPRAEMITDGSIKSDIFCDSGGIAASRQRLHEGAADQHQDADGGYQGERRRQSVHSRVRVHRFVTRSLSQHRFLLVK